MADEELDEVERSVDLRDTEAPAFQQSEDLEHSGADAPPALDLSGDSSSSGPKATPIPLPGGEVAEEDEDKPPSPGGTTRRKRDPFSGWDPVYSHEFAQRSRQLTTLSELKRIKRARVTHEGQRVVTDDVKKLKSLATEPHLPPGEYINYYVEPVRIEYYIPKESRFAVETRFLYIPLIDPSPREQDEILKSHMSEDRFIDLIEIMNVYPIHITDILESYNSSMNLYESLSRTLEDALGGSGESFRTAFYFCEVLSEYEPTVAALEFLGDFLGWNMNWLVRRMNAAGVDMAAADKTISYMIKRRNMFWEDKGLDYDDRFETLAALFYEQAFPNRGLESEEEDYFYDIFDQKVRY